MMKKNQEAQEKANEGLDTLKDETVIEENESKLHKIIKYGLIGLATIATGVLGFVLGRNNGSEDKEEESETEEKAE